MHSPILLAGLLASFPLWTGFANAASFQPPVLPAAGGTGAAVPWGGPDTDAGKRILEAHLANAAGAAMNRAWARADHPDNVIVAIPLRMLKTDEDENGDGQLNSTTSLESWSGEQPDHTVLPPLVATLLLFNGSADHVVFSLAPGALSGATNSLTIRYTNDTGTHVQLSVPMPASRELEWVVPSDLRLGAPLGRKTLLVSADGAKSWLPVLFHIPVRAIGELNTPPATPGTGPTFMDSVPKDFLAYKDGRYILDHESVGIPRNPGKAGLPIDRLRAKQTASDNHQPGGFSIPYGIHLEKEGLHDKIPAKPGGTVNVNDPSSYLTVSVGDFWNWTPFSNDQNLLQPLPAAIHFAFELRPDDPNLTGDSAYRASVKNPQTAASGVWGNSQQFMNESTANHAGPAMTALHNHLVALNSADYLAFRHFVLGDLANLAATRVALGPAPFQAMDQAVDELRAKRAFAEQTLLSGGLPSFAHPGLRSGAPSRGTLLAAVNAFARKYATRHNVTAIAGFVTEAGGHSYYSNFSMGRYNGALPNGDAAAKADYALIHPNSMDTTVARLEGTFVHLYAGKTANFYAQADGIGDGPGPGFAFRTISPSTPGALIDEVDVNDSFKLNDDGHGDKTLAFTPSFPSGGTDLETQVTRLSNPANTLPSTTSCVNCHVLPRVGLTATDAGSVQILRPASPSFFLLHEGSLTARTEGELDHEFTKLNLEWAQLPLSSCADPAAVRECLDQSDAAGQAPNACLNKLCTK